MAEAAARGTVAEIAWASVLSCSDVPSLGRILQESYGSFSLVISSNLETINAVLLVCQNSFEVLPFPKHYFSKDSEYTVSSPKLKPYLNSYDLLASVITVFSEHLTYLLTRALRSGCLCLLVLPKSSHLLISA